MEELNMKKTLYIKPATNVVRIEAENQLLTSSLGVNNSPTDGISNEEDVLVKESWFDVEE